MQLNDYINMLVWFLIIGNSLAIIVGLVMMLLPDKLPQITAITDRWISTRQAMRSIEQNIDSDRYSLKHPYIFGIVISLAALLILVKTSLIAYQLSAREGGQLLAGIFNTTSLGPPAWEVIWLTMITFIYLGAALAVFVGITAMFKSTWLLEVSRKANTWVSSRKQLKPVELPNPVLDDYIRARPRLWGGIITATATFVLVVMIWFLAMQ